MSPHYRLGWNDRVAKRTEDYGKAYLTRGGTIEVGAACAVAWTQDERQRYVQGWDDASAKIAELALPAEPGSELL